MPTTTDLLAVSHLMVTMSYIFIPLQFCRCLSHSPLRHDIPPRLIFCLILVALFFFLCGTAHLLLAFRQGDSRWFTWIQCGNALVSTTTAVYLIPLIPDMFTLLDTAVANLQNETKDSKSKLFTFMAFLCHEIRNPLFAITSSAECLQDSITTMADQCASEEVQSILDSSLLMLRLVNDVLDLSKLDSGKLQLECRQFDLHALLKRLGDNMGRQVRRKHQGAVDFECTVDVSVPQFVLGDSVRMVQIIYNLLSNSLKFTSRGRISVEVAALESYTAWRRQQRDDADEANDTVTMSHHRPVAMFANKTTEDDDEEAQVFSMALLSHNHHHHHHTTNDDNDNKKVVLSIVVADTGIGIPHERLHDIFEPYTQAKLSDFRQHGGTGLGLSIISSLTKAMGGTINVTSRPGEGATFHLHLPVQLLEEHTCNTNPLTTTASNKATTNNNMNYVGELLPNDQKQVSNNFLKCQRMPNWTHTSSQDLSSMISHQADADSNQNKDNIAHHETDSTNGKESTTTLLQPPPLFSTTTAIPSPSQPSSPSTENMLDKQSMSLSEKSKTTSNGTACERSRTVTKSFNLPPNNHVVLVVDDNSVNRKILGKMLTTFGIEHRMACNGQEAVDALLASRNYLPANKSLLRYALVLMDVSMPVMDGNEAISAIRQANITVPIVALSANVLSQEQDKTICLGADEFHTKPILRNNLHAICERYLVASPPGLVVDTHFTPLNRPAHDDDGTNGLK